jgi:hypothetical protein
VKELTSRLEGSTTNEETVNVRLLGKLTAVLVADTATVQDSRLVGNLLADVLQPVTDSLVYVLGLLSGSNLASTNSPDGLVGNDNLAPVADVALEALELLGDDLDGLARLALLEALAAAPDDADAVLGGVLGLEGDGLVGLVEDGATLRVAEDSPVDGEVLQLLNRDLTGESTVGLVVDVLGGDLDVVLDVVADEREVESRRGDDDLCGRALAKYTTGDGRDDGPTFESSEALFKLLTISLMDELDPFL